MGRLDAEESTANGDNRAIGHAVRDPIAPADPQVDVGANTGYRPRTPPTLKLVRVRPRGE